MTSSMFFGTSTVQYSAIFFGCLNVINSGMVYGWPSASLPQLLSPTNTTSFHLTSFEGFCAAIAPLLGSIIAAPLSMTMTDLVGPKRTLIYTFYPYVISWIMIALCGNFELLLLARLISGISDGCLFSSFSIYIDDICDKPYKMKLFSLFPICFSLGILLVNILENFSPLFLASTVAAFLTSLSFCGMLLMPESPYFYMMKNRSYQAKEALRWTRGRDEMDEVHRELQKETAHQDFTLKDIFKIASGRFFMTAIILLSAQQLTGISALVFFVSTILKDANIAFYYDSEISIVLFSLLFATAIFSAFFLDTTESKNLLIYSTLGSGIAVFVNALYFQFINFKNDSSFLALIPVTALMVYMICYGLGLNNLPFVMFNEIFPRYARPKILGITHVYSALLAIIVCCIFTIFNDSLRIDLAFYPFSVCCDICCLLILFFVPKTQITCEEAKALLDSCKEKPKETYEFLHSSFEISGYSD